MARRAAFALCTTGAAVLYLFSGTKAALILLCAAVALPLCGVLAAWLAARRMEVTLHVPSALLRGEPVQGTLQIRNRAVFPVVRAVLRLELENTLTRERETVPLAFSAAPLGRKNLSFAFESTRCGMFSFCCAHLAVSDAFGLACFARALSVTERRLVMPELFPMSVRLLGSDVSLGAEDSILLNRRGQDWSEPFQIREYAEGDSPKQIHWKLSQKLDRYIVTDPAQAIDRALLVFWDRAALAADALPEVPDTLAEAVISFCLAAVQEKIPYAVAWSEATRAVCEVRDIVAEEDLYDAVPAMLRAPSGERGVQSAADCVRALDGRRFSLIAYFGDRVPEDVAVLSAMGTVKLFLCGDGGRTGDTGALQSILFSSFDYKQTLRDVTI